MPAQRKPKVIGDDSLLPQPKALATIDAPESKTAIEAILVGSEGWKRRGKLAPIYGDESGAYVSMGAPSEGLSSTDEERAWARVLALSDEHASALLFVMAKYLAINVDPEQPRYAKISVNEMLEYRGYTRDKSIRDFKPKLKIAERDRIIALSRIWVTVPTTRRNSKKIKKQSSQLVMVNIESETKLEQALPNLEMNEIDVPNSFGLILGTWANNYVQNQEARVVLAGIMKYDSRDAEQRIALRLGLFLHFRPAQIITVGDILQRSWIEMPTDQPSRFRANFESALGRLRDDGIIGGWSYMHEEKLPRYKWVDTWLKYEIAIRPAAVEIIEIPVEYKRTEVKRFRRNRTTTKNT